MRIIGKIFNRIKLCYYQSSSDRYIKFLKKKGVKIGAGAFIGNTHHFILDYTRPSLVDIGRNVRFGDGFQLLTHDYVTDLFLKIYDDFIPSSGKVCIGDNVYFARNCSVLKGVTIGNNVIVGYGSIVTHDIPSNSVAVGTPAKVICSIEDYYNKRRQRCVEEAFLYAQSIKERFGREPIPSDFWEEFPLFVDGGNIDEYPDIPIRNQLGLSYRSWLTKHKAPFDGFGDFIKKALLYEK